MIQKHFFKTSRTARVYILAPEQVSKVTDIWLCAHGYGYLGLDFIAMLESLKADHRKIIVPEALSRYYVKGTGGKTGANWMTSDDREVDIEDIHHYLNALLSSKFFCTSRRLHLLGFSQGATTILRWWLNHIQIAPCSVTVWAGGLPNEFSVDEIARYQTEVSLQLVYGTEDPYLNTNYEEQIRNLKAKRGEGCLLTTFQGKHEIDSATLLKLAQRVEV